MDEWANKRKVGQGCLAQVMSPPEIRRAQERLRITQVSAKTAQDSPKRPETLRYAHDESRLHHRSSGAITPTSTSSGDGPRSWRMGRPPRLLFPPSSSLAWGEAIFHRIARLERDPTGQGLGENTADTQGFNRSMFKQAPPDSLLHGR